MRIREPAARIVLGQARSARLEVFSECFADHFGDGYAFVLGAADEQRLELGVEAYGFDARRFRAESRAAALAPPGDEGIHVVTTLGSPPTSMSGDEPACSVADPRPIART
jgi:hypothetical protein